MESNLSPLSTALWRKAFPLSTQAFPIQLSLIFDLQPITASRRTALLYLHSNLSTLNSATFHHSTQPYGEHPSLIQQSIVEKWPFPKTNNFMENTQHEECILSPLPQPHPPLTTYLRRIIFPQSSVSCREKTSPNEHSLAKNSLSPTGLNLSLLTEHQTSSKHLYGQ